MSSSSARVNTLPEGLPGVLTMIARVWRPIARSRLSSVNVHSGGCIGTKLGFASTASSVFR